MENRLSKIRLGILGGGQLARMLALKSHEMGIKPSILSAHPQDPAPQVTPYFVKGSLSSQRDLKRFLTQVDLAIFENEFLNPTLLHSVSLATNTPIHPLPKVMALLQDRLSQKQLLIEHKISTAPFVAVHPKKPFSALTKLFPKGLVLKKRHQGYDGQGTYILKDFHNKTFIEQAQLFIKKHSPLIAEQYIPFKKEMALILVRNRNNQQVELPLVQTFQEKACCVWVKGPMRHLKSEPLIKKLKLMMKEINYEGVMAFELFDTQTGELMVNEIAPRVHNSGHYSLDGLSEDQFSLHIKAVLNMDIQDPIKIAGGFAMLNLLGEKQEPFSQWLPSAGTNLHWYGKQKSRPGRKMGHINKVDRTAQKALSSLLDFYSTVQAKTKS